MRHIVIGGTHKSEDPEHEPPSVGIGPRIFLRRLERNIGCLEGGFEGGEDSPSGQQKHDIAGARPSSINLAQEAAIARASRSCELKCQR